MNPRLLLSLKLMTALALVTAIVTFGARQCFPRVPLERLALWSLIGWVGALLVIGLLVPGRVVLSQFILQRGGTDLQWLSLGKEPPRLERLRRGGFARRWSD